MKLSIRHKLLPIPVIGVVVVAIVLYLSFFQSRQAVLETQILDGLRAAQKSFSILRDNDIKTLQAAMTDFMTNQAFKDRFLQNDRQELYNYGQGLYAQHKALGITHFYFIRKDGTVLTRLHEPNTFDDKVTRKTFETSKSTQKWGVGIELGKTAFALRVVHPYLNKDELIGYVEFGQEIDHFLEIMKSQTGNEYAVVVKKKFISPDAWASVMKIKGHRNNYDDFQDYLVIDATSRDQSLFNDRVIKASQLDAVADTGTLISVFDEGGKTYAGGAFSLLDAAGERVGAVVAVNDITTVTQAFRTSGWNMLMITAVGVVLISLIMVVLISRIIVVPLEKIVGVMTRVAGGDFAATIDVTSNDEIGVLAELISQFRKMMVDTVGELRKLRRR